MKYAEITKDYCNAALDAWHVREEETVGPRRRVRPRIVHIRELKTKQ